MQATSKQELTPEVERAIVEMLKALEVRTNVTGYRITRDALRITYEDETLLTSFSSRVYPMLAEMHDSAPARVERNLRHSIALTWEKGNWEEIVNIFGPSTYQHGAPSVSLYISRLAEELKLRLSRERDRA